jgi:uncharacterized protein (DUF433 family)
MKAITMEDILRRIVIDPKVMVGKPVIKGTRVPVELILGLLGQGATYEDILKGYPRVTKEDIYACLLFAQQAINNSLYVPPIVTASK